MTKILKLIAVFTLLSLISAIIIGCSMASTYKRIKSDPNVEDFEVYDNGGSMDFKVILKSDSNLSSDEANELAEDFAVAVQPKFKNKTINIRITKNNEELGSYSLSK